MPVTFRSSRERLSSFYVAFIRSSVFYKLSLDKRSNLFDTAKFIDDPWPGDINVGKNIVNNGALIDSKTPLEISDFLLYKPISDEYETSTKYLNSFSWIRDLQVIGGNNSRRYARKLIRAFIYGYQTEKKFWSRKFQWDEGVVGERLTNWILAHSFVAAGASDDFQKAFFSSLNEQYSHLLKSYKGVKNLLVKLLAIKGLVFCQSIMKNKNNRLIKSLLGEMSYIISNIVDNNGMIESRNPTELFNVFRSLIEIKFISKNLNIDYDTQSLPNIASCIRFLRLGNGEISEFCGDCKQTIDFIKPSRQIVDAAISTIDPTSTKINPKLMGFDRLATKKIITLINTKISEIKSKFNSEHEPGINIFDFESSFGTDKVINRADIAIASNGFWLKAPKNSRSFSKRKVLQGGIYFEGEMQNLKNGLPFSIRRELTISSTAPNISGTDFIFLDSKYSGKIRFALTKSAVLSKANENGVLISVASRKYKLLFQACEFIKKIIIRSSPYPTIECLIDCNSGNIQIEWTLAQLDS